MAKNNNKSTVMSTKKKNRKLFWGILSPLLIIVLIACGFLFLIANGLSEYYLKAEVERQVEKINSQVLEKLYPITINIEDFKNFGELSDDNTVIDTLIHTYAKNLPFGSYFYYSSKISRFKPNGVFAHSGNWVPPTNWDPTKRGWFTDAIENEGNVTYSDPYIDATTGELAVTLSQTVNNTSGKVKGVVACDILLDQLALLMNNLKISKHSSAHMITAEGLYMTHPDSSKVMQESYFKETKYKGDLNQWLNGELKAEVNSQDYFAVCKVGSSPWFIVIEGNAMDIKGIISNIIIIIEIALVFLSLIAASFNIHTIRRMRKDEQKLGSILYEETQNLVVAAKENAATAQDQSAAVKEIVATMEDSNALSENIASKIHDVSKVAEKTSVDVAKGVASIEQNVRQLHAIFDANQQTIDGMKVLSERIESIWDIVTLINNVADQAKIIAFNAELEASSAGEAGKSFRIVANEIRRLSDGIIDGTKEIKERINEIQHSSDSLILASESGTEKINEGYENAKDLGEMFNSIKNSAEVTATSAGEITEIISQQTTASEQILIALKQISAGVENFTVATDNISTSSEHIRTMSEEMNNSIKTESDADVESRNNGKSRK